MVLWKDFSTRFGWSLEGGRYRHPLFREGFRFEDLTVEDNWQTVAHFLRESFRSFHFEKYKNTNRHDVVAAEIPDYSPERRRLALRWATNDGMALLALMGGIQSPLLRYQLRGISQKCSKCGMIAPPWDHLWTCHAKVTPPQRLSFEKEPMAKDWGGLCYMLSIPWGNQNAHWQLSWNWCLVTRGPYMHKKFEQLDWGQVPWGATFFLKWKE